MTGTTGVTSAGYNLLSQPGASGKRRRFTGGETAPTTARSECSAERWQPGLLGDAAAPSAFATGRELNQADLIRNFVLMGLERRLQTRLYEQFWRPMELDFGQEAYGRLNRGDLFTRRGITGHLEC
jgi:hypothetical protein